MSNPLIVTGFVPIPNHPRAECTYHRLADPLRRLHWNKTIFQQPLSSCWLAKHLDVTRDEVHPAQADNPKKNTPEYHIVQHQKFQWLASAAETDEDYDPLVWIDYGIFHVSGITRDAVEGFLDRVHEETHVTLPGCWKRTNIPISDDYPCWRFCGGLIICPRNKAVALCQAVMLDICQHISRTKRLSWEVNTLARVEQRDLVSFRQYQADHNETMFTEYR
jgi:hypothetical protein